MFLDAHTSLQFKTTSRNSLPLHSLRVSETSSPEKNIDFAFLSQCYNIEIQFTLIQCFSYWNYYILQFFGYMHANTIATNHHNKQDIKQYVKWTFSLLCQMHIVHNKSSIRLRLFQKFDNDIRVISTLWKFKTG